MSGKFWETLCAEHGINLSGTCQEASDLQLKKVSVFFKEAPGNRLIPRVVLADLDPEPLDSIRSSPIGQLFSQSNYISGGYGAGGSWAKGYYNGGAEIANSVLEAVNSEVEACDCLQGFQVAHSLDGGTGGGMGTLLVDRLHEEYPGKIVETFSVFPSHKVSDCSVQAYNVLLSLCHLAENADIVHSIDNEVLYSICAASFGCSNPTYSDLNYLASRVMNGVTSSFRFPCLLNADLRKLAFNFVPFPRLHFLTSGIAPLVNSGPPVKPLTVPELVSQMSGPKNMMCGLYPDYRQYVAASAIFRGKISAREIDDAMLNLRTRTSVDWIPDNIKSAICEVPSKDLPVSATLVSNSFAILEVFKRINEEFVYLFRRKAYLHSYVGNGLDEMDLVEAESNMNDLILEYEGSLQAAEMEVFEMAEEVEEAAGIEFDPDVKLVLS